jgi:tetratricopeptide (TPR) repeat protein
MNEYLDLVAGQVPLFAAGLQAHREGRLTQARAAYIELMDRPDLVAVCLHQLGVIAGQQGDHMRATEFLRRAIRLDEQQPLFHHNLVYALRQMGRHADALDVLTNLGVLLQTAEKHAEAINVYKQVLAVDTCRYAAYINMGTAYALLRDPVSAVDALIRGVALHAQVLIEAKHLLDDIMPGLIEARVAAPETAIPTGMPTGPVEKLEHALTTLGKTLSDLAQAHAAITCYQMALKLSPGLALAHWNLSLSLLSIGDHKNGWDEYMWRWFWDRFPEPWRRLPMPHWRGEDLTDKTIVVFGEQGFGDIMQFSPLIFDIQQRAKEVLFEAPTPLLRLFKQSLEPRGIKVFSRNDNPHIMENPVPVDYIVPLMSLPHFTGLNIDKLPLEAHLKATPEDKAVWKDRLSELKGTKIGIVWAGRPAYSDDAKRTISLERFMPLFDVPGISWVSLQVGPRSQDAQQLGVSMYDASSFLTDFADTAALISELDQVIAVDTAVAHLASILGVPTWILLPKVPDWRWLLERTDTPWYPHTRLFRQAEIGNWDHPLGELRAALAQQQAEHPQIEHQGEKPSRKQKETSAA